VRPMLARCERRFVTFGLLFLAALGVLVAFYLFSSAVLIENGCFLAGERTCAAASSRVWIAMDMAGGSVVEGLAVGIFMYRTRRAR
jgi:hypothetical protein